MRSTLAKELADSFRHSAREVAWYFAVVIPDTLGMLIILAAVATIKLIANVLNVKSDFIDNVHSLAVGIVTIALMVLLAIKVLTRLRLEYVKARAELRRALVDANRDSLVADEIAYESVFLRESSVLKFQGLRMNRALAQAEWQLGLQHLDALHLVFLQSYEKPCDKEQRDHNTKLEDSMRRLRQLKASWGKLKIRVWFTSTLPEQNFLIFDNKLALVRDYERGKMARSNLLTVLSERRGSGAALLQLAEDFEKTCSSASEQSL